MEPLTPPLFEFISGVSIKPLEVEVSGTQLSKYEQIVNLGPQCSSCVKERNDIHSYYATTVVICLTFLEYG